MEEKDEICGKIEQAQQERAKEETERWKKLLTWLKPYKLEMHVMRHLATGPVCVYFPRGQFSVQLTSDEQMLFWSPDNPQVLATGLESPQEAAKFIVEFIRLKK